ncbi:MAG: DUF3365 domain-containing protein [Nitrospirae bacterium]|nr:DUF3365 domain-containing protein [Nitrospirota bacterium]MDE3042297.1 DUF3365 domain-containing protein [Nitrospirota bacterium]MDE3221083.1 DUF3365 domain-containing protein [Nitrospirota bacterium]
MNCRGFWMGLALGTISTCLLGQWVLTAASKEADPPKCIPAETVADYVHSVIQADRTFYTTDVVERMQMRGIVVASENWRETARLPLPAQFLIEAGRLVAEQRSGLRFRLISSWPINKRNRPTTDFERTGLTEILVNSDRPYTGVTTEGGTPVFQALYADKAVSQSCVGCHNAHPNSPKKDFKPRDVMGGILLTIPLHQ